MGLRRIGIDYIASATDWVAQVVTPESGFYRWGPNPPDDVTTNDEAGL